MQRIAKEFFQYVVVGGLAFLIDWSILNQGVALGIHYLVATAIGFVAGLLINFMLCILWIWKGSQAKTVKDFSIFTAIGVAGLAWTELGMWVGVGLLGFKPSPSKVVVAGFVLIWNFALRKILVFSR